MNEMIMPFILTLDATLRLASPLMLCAMAGIFAERSGIVDISLEGKMLSGAFVAAAVTTASGSVWFGLGAAMIATMGLSVLHGFATITHRGDQVVSGLAINMLAMGMTIVVGHAVYGRGGQTPALTNDLRFSPNTLWFADTLRDVPLLGAIYSELLSGHNLLVYLALIAVPATAFILYRTRFGLRLRAVGEVPEAVDTAGISVFWLRYRALILGGLLCGIAGAYLSVALGAGFVREMSAGKGYIALAAVIFGNWRPFRALGACLMFGFLESMTTRLEGVDLPLVGELPTQLMLALPYVLTVLLLAGFIGRPTPPAAIGQPYVK